MVTVAQSEADINASTECSGPSMQRLLDTGHATRGGADPVVLARRHRGRISHVQVKDSRSDVRRRVDAEERSFLRSVLEGVYTVPENGCVDFPAVFRALPDHAGRVVAAEERGPAMAHPLSYAAPGFDTLRGFLAEAGLR